MNNIISNCAPVLFIFLSIFCGCLFGKIKIRKFSFGLSGVLIFSILFGWILSSLNIEITKLELNNLQQYSKYIAGLGTNIFVSSIGLQAGLSDMKIKRKEALKCCLLGIIIPLISILISKIIFKIDNQIDSSLIAGILCGSMTSTPGLISVQELSSINDSLATLGYGSSYIFGVISIIVIVQLITKKEKKIDSKISEKTGPQNDLIVLLALTICSGNLLGNIMLFDSISLGVSGGTLLAGIMVGIIYKKIPQTKGHNNMTLSSFRSLGLVMFFAGEGLPAGFLLKEKFILKPFVYGIIISSVAILCGLILCKFLRYNANQTASIISGCLTSTPAFNLLIDMGVDVNITQYSMTYLSSLITIIFGVKIFGAY